VWSLSKDAKAWANSSLVSCREETYGQALGLGLGMSFLIVGLPIVRRVAPSLIGGEHPPREWDRRAVDPSGADAASAHRGARRSTPRSVVIAASAAIRCGVEGTSVTKHPPRG